ncbi:hypothetical protein D0Z07_3413 [Hyphodiscus hymeniophilus]|uniref:FAD dependent oxidoreductase domain-containing protein n=1 Tax=Hyphodiscus hymeniophilus TaxID=353542 RepID=A0A9P7AYU2_9HELO|nr:hypothetical protein D0Z07_3413 [Hyphodiscus hymeniophilus]
MNTLFSSIRDAYLRAKLLLKHLGEDKIDLAALEARINASPGIPVPNPTTSFWLENPPFPGLVDIRSKSLPRSADIIIIGSGITGASVARTILSECAAMGVKRRVVMLEARQICSGATGRNGGHMKCTPYESFSEYKQRFGAQRAKVLVDFQTSHIPILVDLAHQEKWDVAEARDVETLDVFYDEEAWIEGQHQVEELRQGMPKEAQNTELWDKEAAREIYKVGEHAYGAISFQAGAVWPYRLVTSALNDLLEKYPSGFSIETHTSVENISTTRSPNQPFIIHTSRGDIIASHVVHATNAHTANLVPGLRGKLFPVRGTMSAQRPGTAFPQVDGSKSWCLINNKGYEYITQRPGTVDAIDGLGGEIMIGGGMMRMKGLEEFGKASDAETSYMAGCHLSGVLPMGFGLENWGEDAPGGRMKSLWSGSLGITADHLPFVGRLETSLTGRNPMKVVRSKNKSESVPAPGEWIAAGYNGEGMVNAWLCGVALGLMILGREASTLKIPGKPYGTLDEWFPKEYLCTQKRVTKASVFQLLARW